MLNVLLFSHTGFLCGAERSLIELVSELTHDYGATCTVVVPAHGPLKEHLRNAGAACIEVSSMPWWAFARALNLNTDLMWDTIRPGVSMLLSEVLPQARQLKPDIVLTQTMVIPWGALTASLLEKPHIWNVCEYGALDHDLVFPYTLPEIAAFIQSCSSHIVTPSHSVAQTVFPNAPAHQISIAYRFISIPDEELSSEFDCFPKSAKVRLGVFATLTEGKGQDDVVKATAELVSRGHDVELLLAGNDFAAFRPRLENLARKLKITDRVLFGGFLPQPYTAMKSCDVIVVSARHDAFGRVPLEAMLMERPVVYARSGALVEMMIDGQVGLSYPPADIAALSDRIETLILDRDLAATLVRNATKYASETFTKERYGGTIHSLMVRLKQKHETPAQLPTAIGSAMADAFKSFSLSAASVHQAEPSSPTDSEFELERLHRQEKALTTELARSRFRTRNIEAKAQTEAKKNCKLQGELHEMRSELSKLKSQLAQRERAIEAMQSSSWWQIKSTFENLLHKNLRHTPLSDVELVAQTDINQLTAIISSSGIFDHEFYLFQNPDLATEQCDPISHYLLRGAAEGRDPHPLFDTSYYLDHHPELRTNNGANPLIHFIQHSNVPGNNPHPLFDTEYYLTHSMAGCSESTNPLVHFIEHGTKDRLNPHPLFDASFYLESYTDVARAKLNPLIHFVLFGGKERRNPHPFFDTAFYMYQHPRLSSQIPLVHYLQHGANESFHPHTLFDNRFYIQSYPDVAESALNPLVHYIMVGEKEGRRTTNGRVKLRRSDAPRATEHQPEIDVLESEPTTQESATPGTTLMIRSNRSIQPLIEAVGELSAISSNITFVVQVEQQLTAPMVETLNALSSRDNRFRWYQGKSLTDSTSQRTGGGLILHFGETADGILELHHVDGGANFAQGHTRQALESSVIAGATLGALARRSRKLATLCFGQVMNSLAAPTRPDTDLLQPDLLSVVEGVKSWACLQGSHDSNHLQDRLLSAVLTLCCYQGFLLGWSEPLANYQKAYALLIDLFQERLKDALLYNDALGNQAHSNDSLPLMAATRTTHVIPQILATVLNG